MFAENKRKRTIRFHAFLDLLIKLMCYNAGKPSCHTDAARISPRAANQECFSGLLVTRWHLPSACSVPRRQPQRTWRRIWGRAANEEGIPWKSVARRDLLQPQRLDFGCVTCCWGDILRGPYKGSVDDASLLIRRLAVAPHASLPLVESA